MTNKQLQEILSDYPDECNIYIFDNDRIGNLKDIEFVKAEMGIEYHYLRPTIIIK